MAENHLTIGSGDYSSGSILQGSTDSNGFIINQKNKDSVRLAALQNEWNKQAVDRDREYNEWYYNKYSSPEAMMRQYKEAGLNPYGVFGQSFNGSSGQTSTQQVGDIAASSNASAANRQADTAEKSYGLQKVTSSLNLFQSAADQFNNSLNSAAQRSLMSSQADAQRAQAQYVSAQAEAQRLENQRLSLRNGWYSRPYHNIQNYKPESGATVGEVNSYYSALGDYIPGKNMVDFPSNVPNDFQGLAIRGALGFANGIYSSNDIKNMSIQALRSMELSNDVLSQNISESHQRVQNLKADYDVSKATFAKIGQEMLNLQEENKLTVATTQKILEHEIPGIDADTAYTEALKMMQTYNNTEARVRSEIWNQVKVYQRGDKPYTWTDQDGTQHKSLFTRQWLELYEGTPYLHGGFNSSWSVGQNGSSSSRSKTY